MQRSHLVVPALALLTSCVTPSHPAPAAAAPGERMAMQEVPGSEHAALAPFVGSFKARVAFEVPGQPESVSYGSYDVRWMGKMWLVGEFKSDSVDQPFEGTGLVGYDLMTRQYTTWWFDTKSSAPQVSHGIWEPIARQMVMHSDAVHGMPPARVVTTVSADGSRIKSEVFAAGPHSDELRVMYIEYTRR